MYEIIYGLLDNALLNKSVILYTILIYNILQHYANIHNNMLLIKCAQTIGSCTHYYCIWPSFYEHSLPSFLSHFLLFYLRVTLELCLLFVAAAICCRSGCMYCVELHYTVRNTNIYTYIPTASCGVHCYTIEEEQEKEKSLM